MIQLSWNTHSLISKFNINLVFQWIPGHAGVPGNETNCQKRGAALPQIEKPATYETVTRKETAAHRTTKLCEAKNRRNKYEIVTCKMPN